MKGEDLTAVVSELQSKGAGAIPSEMLENFAKLAEFAKSFPSGSSSSHDIPEVFSVKQDHLAFTS